jgi:hypothetical protein
MEGVLDGGTKQNFTKVAHGSFGRTGILKASHWSYSDPQEMLTNRHHEQTYNGNVTIL